MRLSSPMPRATSCTSAPTFSDKIGDLVDEGDLGGEEGVGGVFDQFRGAPGGEHQRRLVERQRPVDFADHLARALVRGADHDAVGKLEIADRRALAQEFRIGGDRDVGGRIGFADHPLDLVAGADRHGRLGDHDGEALERRGDLARGGIDIGQVGVAVAAPRRRADRNEHRIGLGDRRGQIGREIEPAGLHVGGDQRIEAGLEDRDFAAAQRRDLVAILVDAGDVVAEIRKAGAGHQPHIARADHGDTHLANLSIMVNGTDFGGGLKAFHKQKTDCDQENRHVICMNKGE